MERLLSPLYRLRPTHSQMLEQADGMDQPKLKSIQITVVLISRTLFPLIQVVSKNGQFQLVAVIFLNFGEHLVVKMLKPTLLMLEEKADMLQGSLI